VDRLDGEVLLCVSVILIGCKEDFILLFFCQSSMAMRQGSDDPAGRVFPGFF